MMLVAAAAMAFVSCQKDDALSQSESQTYITFTSANPVSKTHWDGQTITWSDDDAIRVALMVGDTWYQDNSGAKLYQSNNKLNADAQTAKFSVSGFTADKISAGGWAGAYQFYGLYPDSAEDANFGKSTSKASIEIPTEQALSSDTFDKSADILWGKAVNTYSELPASDVSMVWKRVVAHAYISLNDINGIVAGEIVKSVSFTAQSDADLTGDFELHMATGEFTPKSAATNKVVLTSNEGVTLDGNDLTLWACINPCTLTELDIEIDTDKAVYTIKKTGFSREFKVNQRNILPVNMTDAERSEKVDMGKSYLYTFTSYKWEDETKSWTSDANGYQKKDEGISVTRARTGAGATTNAEFTGVTKVVVTYCTNASSGKGSVDVSVGNEIMSQDVTSSGGKNHRTVEYVFSNLSGKITFKVNCTENSIYIKSVEIFAAE